MIETRDNVISKRYPQPTSTTKQGASSSSSNNNSTLANLKITVLRAIHLLITEFTVSSFTLWSSFAFGTVFLFTQSIPIVYSTLYSFTESSSSLIQSTILLGEILGFLACLIQNGLYANHVHRRHKANLPTQLEKRLYLSVLASFLGLTAGLFIYAWTSLAEQHYHWALPSTGLLLVGFGITCIVQAASIYITDRYAEHAASAIAAVAMGENVFAAFLPLAANAMYSRLGFGWASSLVGFVALGVSFAPIGIVVLERRRRRSGRE